MILTLIHLLGGFVLFFAAANLAFGPDAVGKSFWQRFKNVVSVYRYALLALFVAVILIGV